MKIEMIIKRRLNPPRYVAGLGWTQDEFWSVEELKKDNIIIEGSQIEAEIQSSGRIEAVYGRKKTYPTPPIDRLFLYIDGVLEMFKLLSHEEKSLEVDIIQLICEVEKD